MLSSSVVLLTILGHKMGGQVTNLTCSARRVPLKPRICLKRFMTPSCGIWTTRQCYTSHNTALPPTVSSSSPPTSVCVFLVIFLKLYEFKIWFYFFYQILQWMHLISSWLRFINKLLHAHTDTNLNKSCLTNLFEDTIIYSVDMTEMSRLCHLTTTWNPQLRVICFILFIFFLTLVSQAGAGVGGAEGALVVCQLRTWWLDRFRQVQGSVHHKTGAMQTWLQPRLQL